MAKPPEINVPIRQVLDLDKINIEKPPTRVHLSSTVISALKNDTGLQEKVKKLMMRDVQVVPLVKGGEKGTYIPPPKQNPNQLSKPLVGFRLQDLKANSLTSPIYATSRPRPLRGLVATVFGATGFLGLQVVQALANHGAQVVCPVRLHPLGQPPTFEKDIRSLRLYGEQGQVFSVPYDPANFDDLSKVVNRSQMVFNCIGPNLKFPLTPDNFGLEGVYLNIPRNIARACTMKGVQRFVHVSHLNADPNSNNEHFRYKGLSEEAVLEEFPNAIICRPADLFGKNDSFTTWMIYYWSRRSPLMRHQNIFLLRGKEYVQTQPVWVVDAARGIVRAAMREECFGNIIELGGPQRYKLIELFRYIEGIYRADPSKINLYSTLEAKARLENRPVMVRQKRFCDLHLRQDCVSSANIKSWDFIDIDSKDLQKVENVAPYYISHPGGFYQIGQMEGFGEARDVHLFGTSRGSRYKVTFILMVVCWVVALYAIYFDTSRKPLP